MPVSSRKVSPPAFPEEAGERVRRHSPVRPQSHRLVFFGLGLVVGLSLAVLLVITGQFPGSSGASSVTQADRAADIGRLGGKGCRKKVFDNQTGEVTEISCDTTTPTYDANGKLLAQPSAERVNAIGRWFKR